MQNSKSNKTAYRLQLPAINLSVAEWGDRQGQPLIALHGWLDNMASFYPLIGDSEWLSENNIRLIAIDWPGHGHSGHRQEGHPCQLLEYVQDLYDLLDGLGLEKASFLGHSMGASIATLFAGAFPDKAEQLLLIEGISPLTQPEQEAPEQLARAITERHRHKDRQQRFYKDLEAVIRARMHNTDLSRENVSLLVERNMQLTESGYQWRSDPRLRLPSQLRLSQQQAQAFIENLSMPVLLLYGKQGFVKKYSRLAELIRTSTHINAIGLEGGHHFHMQYPESVISAILDFIKNNKKQSDTKDI